MRIIDADTHEAIEFKAKVIFLCASTLESARILLNSATPGQPTGLGNASDQLGRNLMDHIKGAGASGRVEGLDDKTAFGRRPTGVYIPRFRNLDARSHRTDFVRGYGYQGGAGGRGPLWSSAPGHRASAPTSSASLKGAIGGWGFGLSGFAECLPNPENRMVDRSGAQGRLGHPDAEDLGEVGRQRAATAPGHGGAGGRDARGRRA